MQAYWKVKKEASLHYNWVGLFCDYAKHEEVLYIKIAFKNHEILEFNNTEVVPVYEHEFLNEPVKSA